MTIQQIQETILNETGIKTSVRKNKGSMKHHITIRPIFQNGSYPNFPFEWVTKFRDQFKNVGDTFPYGSTLQIDLPIALFEDTTPTVYKKERKPKPIEQQTGKTWGSKNSQMRLDKAAGRYAKKLNKGGCARYY